MRRGWRNMINTKIDEALVALKAIQTWVNEPVQDKQAADNIKYWLHTLLVRVETLAVEIKDMDKLNSRNVIQQIQKDFVEAIITQTPSEFPVQAVERLGKEYAKEETQKEKQKEN